MATSETLAFNPSVSQCIQEAYQRCNVQLTSGMSLSTALFSLNILLSEWGNRGIELESGFHSILDEIDKYNINTLIIPLEPHSMP